MYIHLQFSELHNNLHTVGIRYTLSILQFDFSIFNESVMPRFSAAGDKKFPLIQPTYEVSGVPNMFIGEYHHSIVLTV